MAWTVKWAGCTCTNMKHLYIFVLQTNIFISVKVNLSFFFKYNMEFLLISLYHNIANLPQKKFGLYNTTPRAVLETVLVSLFKS